MSSLAVRGRLAAVTFALLACLAVPVQASDFWTASKTLVSGTSTNNATYDTNQAAGNFAIATDQLVKWTAQRNSTLTGEGDAFWLTSGGALDAVSISETLPNGHSSGTHFLPAGNYRISVNAAAMGPGTYTIEFNLESEITCNPTTLDFGDVLEGTTSAAKTVTVTNTGDYQVTLAAATPSIPAHYDVSGFSGTLAPGASATFQVKYVAGTASGTTPVAHNGTLTLSANGTSGAPDPDDVVIDLEGRTKPALPQIDCCTPGIKNLGSADHTVGGVLNGTVCFENVGDAALEIDSVVLQNDDPAFPVFSLVSAVSTADVPKDGTRSASVHFEPTAAGGERTYYGRLIIESNDPDDAVHECRFSAKAHHPRPIIRIDDTVLNYQEVELGFAFTRAFIIHNDGDAPLHAQVSVDALAGSEEAQWSDHDLGGVTVAPGAASAPQRHTYEPQVATADGAVDEMRLRVQHDDPDEPDLSITLLGRGLAPVPLDAVLVLDRSGSMSEVAGSRQKIEVLGDAVGHFTDLLGTRADAVDDRLGFVKYNHANSAYLPLQVLDAAHVTAALDAVSPAALGDSARLRPDGNTGIGGAMQTAAGLLVGGDPARKHVMVVLTDGKENTDPRVGTVLGPITAADPQLSIYSLGVGSSVDGTLLQSITNVAPGDGYHQVQGDLSGLHFFDLEAFYFKIFVDAAGWETVVDPTHPVHLDSPDAQVVDSADIVTSDHSAVFVVYEIPELRPYYELQLLDPAGSVIVPGSSVGGVPVHVLTRPGYRVVRVVFPDVEHANDYVGRWTLQLQPNGTWNPEKARSALKNYPGYAQGSEWVSPFNGLVPIGFGAAVASDYRLEVSVLPSGTEPGALVTLTGSLTDRGWPAPLGQVHVTATLPDGTQLAPQPLLDTGTGADSVAGDAVFTGTFVHTGQAGTYRLLFRSLGQNERGELAPREEVRFVHLEAKPAVPVGPNQGRTDDDCIPCPWLWVMWAAVIVLLLIILLRLRR